MILKPTKIKDCFVIELEKKEDERGFLARIFDKEELRNLGISLDIVQGYMTYTKKKGTIRGIHYQASPFAEVKLVRVTSGSVYEIVIDLRKNSSTYKQWLAFEFKASDYKELLIPPNCGHAILALEDNTELTNFYSQSFAPEFERGIRFDDPSFNINWPIPIEFVSDKDKSWEDYK